MASVYVVGAGLAGLSAAVRLAKDGAAVTLYEAAGHAGGRCRSFFDTSLDRLIDNGNHLMLSGNRSVMSYLAEIGSADSLIVAREASFPFFDLASGERWTVRLSAGRLPWWIFAPSRRVPGSRARDYLAPLRLARAGPDDTIADCLDGGRPIYRKFWEPLAVAVLNTEAEAASARLLWPVLSETLGRGGKASRACIARDGLSASLIDPALGYLKKHGAEVRLGARLRRIDIDKQSLRVVGLNFGAAEQSVGPADSVVLALPPAAAQALLPDLEVPRDSRPIVNAHFDLDRPPAAIAPEVPFLGLIGGTAQWLFVRGTMVSVTVSAASDLVDQRADIIARRLWADVAKALELPTKPMAKCRVVKEKRATFAQTPREAARRPGVRTECDNLFLAGDWTDTGLPATIESAVRSGERAAAAAAARAKSTP